MSETALPTALDAQVAEAAKGTPGYVPTPTVVNFRDRSWTIPTKPSAVMLYHIESDHLMHAIKSLLSAYDFEAFLDLGLAVDELEPFIEACNSAWGMSSGN